MHPQSRKGPLVADPRPCWQLRDGLTRRERGAETNQRSCERMQTQWPWKQDAAFDDSICVSTRQMRTVWAAIS